MANPRCFRRCAACNRIRNEPEKGGLTRDAEKKSEPRRPLRGSSVSPRLRVMSFLASTQGIERSGITITPPVTPSTARPPPFPYRRQCQVLPRPRSRRRLAFPPGSPTGRCAAATQAAAALRSRDRSLTPARAGAVHRRASRKGGGRLALSWRVPRGRTPLPPRLAGSAGRSCGGGGEEPVSRAPLESGTCPTPAPGASASPLENLQ
jgi:hypothetical protein